MFRLVAQIVWPLIYALIDLVYCGSVLTIFETCLNQSYDPDGQKEQHNS